ncbi:hypothetical protein NU118_003964 [Salmonella enterica]|nr:hypothetical protein [Salmonella enterica]EGO3296241.1 hypothetical protein [Salmonella enterica]EIK9021628.1 hypothetical protein [Salmonella enterica]EJF0650631.1 hypothetical protein [Salmonella enterica]EJP2999429.1 hypothetical protein [Salmonella enterica]
MDLDETEIMSAMGLLMALVVILYACFFLIWAMRKDRQNSDISVPRAFFEDEPPVMGGWEKHAYPLTQVIVSVNAQPHTITRDLVFCLERAASCITSNELPGNAEGCHYRGDYGNTGLAFPEYSVHWHVHARLCFESPGFFPEGAGCTLPPLIKMAGYLAEGSLARHIVVIVQGTKHTSREFLSRYLTDAANSIATGATEGSEFDDDSGYAFIVVQPVSVT